jgi:hypothetical protein
MQPTRRACDVLLALAAVSACGTALGQVVSSVTPLALRPGQTHEVVFQGTALADARQFWSTFPQTAGVVPEGSAKDKNPGRAAFRVTVPAQAPLGIYGIRLATTTGVSPLRLMLLDDLATVRAAGTNLSRPAAQVLRLPTAVEGTLAPQQLHYFKFHAEAGQRLAFEVYARRIGSLLDPTIRLFDSRGRELTYSDDVPGLSEDAAIARTFRSPGDYVLALSDNLYQGGGDYFYRLRIGDFPAAALPDPLAATRGTEFTCRFADNARTAIDPFRGKAPGDPSQTTLFVPVRRSEGNAQSFAQILLSDHTQARESEPNDSSKTATRVNLGEDLNGRLDAPDDVDAFLFHSPANEFVRFTSVSRRLGSPADLVLRLTKIDGAMLATAESQGSQEAAIEATLPAAGDYVLDVRDLSHRGGPRFVYHVEAIAEPDKSPKESPSQARTVRGFSLSAAADSVVVPARGTVAVAVTAARSAYGGPISINAVGLPAGVKSRPTWIGRGEDTGELTLQSSGDLPAGVIHSIRIVGSPERSDSTVVTHTTDAARAELGGMPYPPPALCSNVALVAGSQPNFTLQAEPSALVVAHDRPATFKLVAERQKGFDEEIAVALSPAKKGLPPGVAVKVKPIVKGASSAEVTVTADGNAAPNVATIVLVGTLKKGQQTFTEPAPGIDLKIEPPRPARKPEGKKS